MITNVSSTFTVGLLSLRSLRASCVACSVFSLCVRPSVTSRDLYTMLFPISFQWTPPHPPRSPRMHCGFPEAFASTVHQTIPANFRVCFPMRLCSLPRTPRGFCYTLPRAFSHGLLFRPFTASPLPHVSHTSL